MRQLHKNYALIIFFIFISGCFNGEIVNYNVLLGEINDDEILDPSQMRFAKEYLYLENVGVRLLNLDKYGNYELMLADSMKRSADGKEYVFKLKQDARFSDGTLITGLDVVESFKRVILKGSPHSTPSELFVGGEEFKKQNSIKNEMEGIKLDKDGSIKLRLNYPAKEILYYLQLADYSILHQKQRSPENLKGKDWNLSSGAYFLEFNHNGVILKQNPYFKAIDREYYKRLPIIKPITLNENQVIHAIENNEIHFGRIPDLSFHKNVEKYQKIKNISLHSNYANTVNYLILNSKSGSFQNLKTRQWLYRTIAENFDVPSVNPFVKKAYQFYVPGAKGYVDEINVNKIINQFPKDHIPEILKNGIRISSLTTISKYQWPKFEEKIRSALPVTIEFINNIEVKDFQKALKERNWDIFFMSSFMTYNVLGEALNLAYTSENPKFIDPSGRVHKYLNEYHRADNSELEAISIQKILTAMIEDAECVPIYYMSTPNFYNTDLIDPSEVNQSESGQFWKLKRKN